MMTDQEKAASASPEWWEQTRGMHHITPLARCERTSTGIPIGIAHIRRQPNGPAVTHHKPGRLRRFMAWMSGRSTIGEAVAAFAVATVIGIALAAVLFHGWSGGFR